MRFTSPAQTGGPVRTRRLLAQVLPFVFLGLLVFWASPLASSIAPAAERTLYFKLPIEGVRFHWRFLDSAAFLSGELTLRIINKNHDQTLVVFRDGKLLDGWTMIGETRPDGSYYYGFETNDRIRTKANDSLVITLTAPKDLLGQGPFSEGVLSAGTWQMHGTYSAIYGKRLNPLDVMFSGEAPVAFMQCWAGTWPITITKREGWRGAGEEKAPGVFRKLTRDRGTNLRACGSHY